MIGFIIVFGIGLIYTLYAGWSSPVMRENEDGSWTTIRPERKFSDLFKKK